MALRAIKYIRAPAGPAEPAPDIVRRRLEMDKRGENLAYPVTVFAHSSGPGKAEWVRPIEPSNNGAILFLHGSGFSKGSPASHRPLVARIVSCSGLPAFVPDYRLAPEHRFPAALEDGLKAYRIMLRIYSPKHIVFIGDSAGGGLALAILHAAKDEGLPMPAAIATLSAWTDLSVSGADRPDVNDPIVSQEMLRHAADMYLDGADPSDPYASPLLGDLSDFPPLLMQVGGREIMIEDTTRFIQKANKAGGAATATVYPDMAHVFQLNAPATRQAEDAIRELCNFLKKSLSPANFEATKKEQSQ